jgi:DNA-binding CsgD family transcriptional regulator
MGVAVGAAVIEARIVDSAANGRTLADIARRHNVTLGVVRDVLARRGWDVPLDPGHRARWTGNLVAVADDPDDPPRGRGRPPRVPGSLTPRELVILAAIADGLTEMEIAEREQVSKYTVHAQARSACTSLGASTRAQAVAIAFRMGMLR